MRGRAHVVAAAAVITLGGTASGSALGPASASATEPAPLPPHTSSAAATPTAACATGRVEALAATPIREWPATGARIVRTAPKGAAFSCTAGLAAVSDHYTACGRPDADTWIFLQLADRTIGFTYASCWHDTPG